MENKKLNPNSHNRRAAAPNSWSELPLDLLNTVFNRLSFVDFQRAKSVCSSWLSASKQSVPKNNHTPWLILFPDDDDDNKNSYCTLFNPEEKERLYKTQDMGLGFAKSVCKATYGTWLLMQECLSYNLHIINLFTKEIVILPPMEGKLTKLKNKIVSSAFWIDEKTKDYVVLCNVGDLHVVDDLHVVYSKKVNNSWKQTPGTFECCDMVYKNHKLYFLSYYNDFKVFDFYGDIPQKIFERELNVGSVHSQISSRLSIVATKLVATVTGNVLMVRKMWRSDSRTWSFLVIKVIYSSGNLKEHQLVNSLGNESMLFDQGITVLANDTDGLIANSIYFCDYEEDTKDICYLFNPKTNKMELVHRFDCSSVQFSRARWFIPSFTHA